jgi:hypothetical protein
MKGSIWRVHVRVRVGVLFKCECLPFTMPPSGDSIPQGQNAGWWRHLELSVLR